MKMSETLQKRRKELENSDMDKLSNLPDSIICRIISKLQTNEAVRTSLLSSRYKSLWMNITSLRFHFRDFRGNASLGHFVNRVLIFLKSKSINEFCLTVETPCDLYDITTWVSAAIYMNVKVLRFMIQGSFRIDKYIPMPASLYTSKTLEVLEICNTAPGNFSLNVPKFVSLPKLTKLELGCIIYSSDESFRRLISGCTSLAHLRISINRMDGVTTFTIDSPTLKTLSCFFWSIYYPIEQDLKFELNTPALIHFYLRDDTTGNFSTLESLEHAYTMVASTTDIKSHYERVVQFLQEVHNVNHLWISGDTLEALSHTSSQQEYPSYALLTTDRKDSKQSSLQDLLDGSTKYHDIYLSKDSSDTTHVVRWSKPRKLPVCLLSYLKTISVSGFRGREGELTMIAYILKNAKMLKKITISEKSEIREKILKFDQGSERCEILFS